MDYKHIAAVVIGIALGVAGAFAKYDFKGDVCGQAAQSQAAAAAAPASAGK